MTVWIPELPRPQCATVHEHLHSNETSLRQYWAWESCCYMLWTYDTATDMLRDTRIIICDSSSTGAIAVPASHCASLTTVRIQTVEGTRIPLLQVCRCHPHACFQVPGDCQGAGGHICIHTKVAHPAGANGECSTQASTQQHRSQTVTYKFSIHPATAPFSYFRFLDARASQAG